MSRRTGTSVTFSVGSWTTIPFDTFERNIVGAAFDGNNFDLLAGIYVYRVCIPVHCNGSDTIDSFTIRFLNVDTSFALQNIALQGFLSDTPTATIDALSGFQSGIIEFWKIA
jgi:hypothetical protein